MKIRTFLAAGWAIGIAAAQGLGPPAGAISGTQAIQLPLSGRTAQTGGVAVQQTPVPGVTSGVNTVNTTLQVQGPYAGSVPAADVLPDGSLTLAEAVRRALEHNLGPIGLSNLVRQSRGRARAVRSSLLPNLSSSLREVVQETNLRALGVRLPLAPTIVGPFNYFDLRANLSQTLLDLTSLNNYRAAQASAEAAELALRDARDLVTLAVGGAYLQTLAAQARLDALGAQVQTAEALLKQNEERKSVGFVAQLDVNRSRVQLQTQRQRVLTLENDIAKQKVNLARLAGLPPLQEFQLATDVPFAPAPPLSMEEAVEQAERGRHDLHSAQAEVRAAENSLRAAQAERLPSLSLQADYGLIGTNPAQSHGTFSLTGALRIPIWQGGRVEASIEQAKSVLSQRRAEVEDLRSRIRAEIRTAFLDLQAAEQQVQLARQNAAVARQSLELMRQRYDEGVSTSVEVVQAQETLATAELDTITALFSHNLAKLTLARHLGGAAENLPKWLSLN
jgi:outer membrane protein TolC